MVPIHTWFDLNPPFALHVDYRSGLQVGYLEMSSTESRTYTLARLSGNDRESGRVKKFQFAIYKVSIRKIRFPTLELLVQCAVPPLLRLVLKLSWKKLLLLLVCPWLKPKLENQSFKVEYKLPEWLSGTPLLHTTSNIWKIAEKVTFLILYTC